MVKEGLIAPDCEVCKFLRRFGVTDKLINAYHKGEIALTSLPKDIQVKLLRFYHIIPKGGKLQIIESHMKSSHETRELRRKVIEVEVKYALSNPLEYDELRALYRAYYKDWSREELEKIWKDIQTCL